MPEIVTLVKEDCPDSKVVMETDVQASAVSSSVETAPEGGNAAPTTPPPSYVKLAMRNMVRKRGKSLKHFFLTTIALLSVFIGLAYLTR